jgi:hypothetical protein
MPESKSLMASPPVVALASWLVPGAGYWLIGQRGRALATGLSIIMLFILGLLIGGVRLIEVPGWGDHGRKLMAITEDRGSDGQGRRVIAERVSESGSPDEGDGIWVMEKHPLDEVRNKPWSIPQILAGPIDIAASAASIAASHDGPDGRPIGARSHSHTNELGVLYTAVAGMLNLLVILDATYRAVRLSSEEDK